MTKYFVFLLASSVYSQDMLNGNLNTTSPMLDFTGYAFLEILLVVIGILIALQINNWNEDRKEISKEIELVKLLITDLNIKKIENDKDIGGCDNWYEQATTFLDSWYENENIDSEEFQKIVKAMSADEWFYSETSPTYIRISNSPLWEKLPEALSHKINEVYYVRFIMIKTSFEKAVEYSTHFKLNYLVRYKLAGAEDSKLLKRTILKNPDIFLGHLGLHISSLERIKKYSTLSSESITKLVEELDKYKGSLS